MEVNSKQKERRSQMSVFLNLVHAAECGRKYRINLKEKTLRIDNKDIPLTENLIEYEDLEYFTDKKDFWNVVNDLYALYKRSAPSAHRKGNKPYFKAEDVENLTDDEIAFNIQRNVAQAILEGYVLLAGLSGWLEWQNENHWFWQSQTDINLVVLKEWIE